MRVDWDLNHGQRNGNKNCTDSRLGKVFKEGEQGECQDEHSEGVNDQMRDSGHCVNVQRHRLLPSRNRG